MPQKLKLVMVGNGMAGVRTLEELIKLTPDLYDITVFGVPLARLCNENFDGVRNRILMKNICYAGVLAALLDVELEVIRTLVTEQYASKPKLVDANMKAIDLGYRYAKEQLPCPLHAMPVAASARHDCTAMGQSARQHAASWTTVTAVPTTAVAVAAAGHASPSSQRWLPHTANMAR